MRTESDLRSALALLEDRADSYREQVPAPEPRRPHRGNRAKVVIAMLATAAVVAAIAVAVPLLTDQTPARSHDQRVGHPGPSSHSPSPRPKPPLATVAAPAAFDVRSYYFTIDKMNGFSNAGGVVFSDLQQANLDSGDGGHYDVTLNAKGAWHPRRTSGEHRVDVAGHRGFYGPLPALPMGVAAMRPIGLAWQYAPGAWATVASWDKTSVPLRRALLIAEAVHPGQPSPFTVPVTVGSLPAGLKLQGALCGPGGTREGQHGYRGFDCLIDYVSTPTGPTMSIEVTGLSMGLQRMGTPFRVGDLEGYKNRDSVFLFGSDFAASVIQLPAQPSGRLELTEHQLVSIARGLRFVPHVSDYSNWVDARTALR